MLLYEIGKRIRGKKNYLWNIKSNFYFHKWQSNRVILTGLVCIVTYGTAVNFAIEFFCNQRYRGGGSLTQLKCYQIQDLYNLHIMGLTKIGLGELSLEIRKISGTVNKIRFTVTMELNSDRCNSCVSLDSDIEHKLFLIFNLFP